MGWALEVKGKGKRREGEKAQGSKLKAESKKVRRSKGKG
jgi:hypothetical protein